MGVEDIPSMACMYDGLASERIVFCGLARVHAPHPHSMVAHSGFRHARKLENETYVVSSPPLISNSPSLAHDKAFTHLHNPRLVWTSARGSRRHVRTPYARNARRPVLSLYPKVVVIRPRGFFVFAVWTTTQLGGMLTAT